MPVGLYVNNTAMDSSSVLSQLYTSSSPSCSSVSSSSVDSRLDSRPVVFVVLTQNELNNLNTSKLNLQFVEHQTMNKEENSDQVSQIDDEHFRYLLGDEPFDTHAHQQQQHDEPNTAKSNIDIAIDAVLAKCRQENPEPSVECIPNVNSEIKIAKKICKRPVRSEPEDAQQSKSTKARTSYISSLIANRDKTAVDDKQPATLSTLTSSTTTTTTTTTATDTKTKNIHTLLTSKNGQAPVKSNQVLIQPKPVTKPLNYGKNQPDFVLNKTASNLSQLLGCAGVSHSLDYERLEQSLCDSDRAHLRLVEFKSKQSKRAKPKRRMDETIVEAAFSPDQSRPKKLKTIADIVKHQASNQPRSSVLVNQNINQPIQLQQQEQQQPSQEPDNQDLTITWINQTNLINNMQYSTNESEQLNMDSLLELELNTEHSSPIDKFIDLDEIDVNPLDYRSGGQMVCNQMDEFNLQFSVCSSASSGFSEPSNFSCSSSISSGSASNLGYTSCASNALSVNNLFSPDESSPCTYTYEHSSPYHNSYSMPNGPHLMPGQALDWNMIEMADKSGPSTTTVNCGENMFANFNFFNDEIKLEI